MFAATLRLVCVAGPKSSWPCEVLGMMAIHRNVIRPKFGNFILLGTSLIDAEVSE
jgi:hypothetical protein